MFQIKKVIHANKNNRVVKWKWNYCFIPVLYIYSNRGVRSLKCILPEPFLCNYKHLPPHPPENVSGTSSCKPVVNFREEILYIHMTWWHSHIFIEFSIMFSLLLCNYEVLDHLHFKKVSVPPGICSKITIFLEITLLLCVIRCKGILC